MSDEIKIGSVLSTRPAAPWECGDRQIPRRYVVTGSTRTSWVVKRQTHLGIFPWEERICKKTLQIRGSKGESLVTLADYEDLVETRRVRPLVEAAIGIVPLETLRAVAALLGLDLSPKTE